MSRAADFFGLWAETCAAMPSPVLPVNYLGFDEDTGEVEVGHEVADGDDPLHQRGLGYVRRIVVVYNLGATDYDA